MTVHEEILQILASYRDASADERMRADAHVHDCAACAAKFAAYGKVDGAVGGLPLPVLPARFRQPLPAVLATKDRRSAVEPPLGFRFAGTLAPAAVVLVLLVALSAIMLSVNAGRKPVTSTPTLTTTLTPTTISARQTEPAVLTGFVSASARPLSMHGFAPTPAPVPAPVAGDSSVLLAGYAAHARMTR